MRQFQSFVFKANVIGFAGMILPIMFIPKTFAAGLSKKWQNTVDDASVAVLRIASILASTCIGTLIYFKNDIGEERALQTLGISNSTLALYLLWERLVNNSLTADAAIAVHGALGALSLVAGFFKH